MNKENSTKGLRTWIEIDQAALASNVAVLRSQTKGAKIMGVVKSNAYGHGLVDFSRALERNGVDWLGVDSVVEGIRLRKEGIKVPILVLGYTLPEKIEEAVDKKISISVSTLELLNECIKMSNKVALNIHIKIDTGFHRQGFEEGQMEELLKTLDDNKSKINVEGLYTHFAKAKNPQDRAYTTKQIELFKKWIEAFKRRGFNPIVHASASAGALVYPEARFDMVRIGAALYGIWPSSKVREKFESSFTLKPVLSWKTIIAETRKVSKGEAVGYDLSETLSRNSILAVCPVGYWHGTPRSLSSVGEVSVFGKRAKIIGRVSMDMIVIDITDIPEAKIGSLVMLIGPDIPVEFLADKAGTTAYEILTGLNPLIKKIYI